MVESCHHICMLETVQAILGRFPDAETVIYDINGESAVNRARCAAANIFYWDDDATHLLFIDSDLEFEPESVLALFEEDSPVVACAYPTKVLEPDKMRAIFESKDPFFMDNWHHFATRFSSGLRHNGPPRKVEEVDRVSGGFLLIQRVVFEKLLDVAKEYFCTLEAYVERAGGSDQFWEFFPTGVYDRELLTEDYGFSKLCRDVGIPIKLITNHSFGHVGKYKFRGNLYNQALYEQGNHMPAGGATGELP